MSEFRNSDSDVALPEGWVWCRLEEVVDVNKETRNPTREIPHEEFVYIDISGVEGGTGRIKEVKKFRGDEAPSRARRAIHTDDVIMSTVRPYLKAFAIVLPEYDGQMCSTGFAVFTCHTHLLPEYLLYVLFSDSVINQCNAMMVGTHYPALNDTHVRQIQIPLPPLPEQRLIAARAEALLERVRRAKEALDRVPLIVKRFRQAVLKKALSGELTAEWRAQQQDLEPAAELLKRVQEERRQRFEEEVKRARAEGRKPPKKPKYLEMELPDISDLPELPEGWVWGRVGDIAESMKNGVYKPEQFYSDNGIACLRMYNIENGSIVWKDIKRMNLTLEEIQEYELHRGDILVNRVNSRELVGKAASIPSGLERCVYESKNIRLRLFGNRVESKYVSFWFQVFSQQFFSRNAQQTVGMASINQKQVGSMPIPFSPFTEQQEMVRRVETLFRFADAVEKMVEEARKRVEQVAQSVLSKAFRGGLTEDFREAVKNWGRLDSEERRKYLVALPEGEHEKALYADVFPLEPADVLLERIREERRREGANTRKHN